MSPGGRHLHHTKIDQKMPAARGPRRHLRHPIITLTTILGFRRERCRDRRFFIAPLCLLTSTIEDEKLCIHFCQLHFESIDHSLISYQQRQRGLGPL